MDYTNKLERMNAYKATDWRNKDQFMLDYLKTTPFVVDESSKDLRKYLMLRCPQGHVFNKEQQLVISNNEIVCPECERNRQIETLKSLGFTPISEELGTRLEVRCNKCGFEFSRRFLDFEKGIISCSNCEKQKRVELAKSVSTNKFIQFVDNDIVEYECPKGHRITKQLSKILVNKLDPNSCVHCENEQKVQWLNSLGFTPVSDNLSEKLEVKCNTCGNVFKRSFSHFKEGAHKCPICTKSNSKSRAKPNTGISDEDKNKISYLKSLGFTPISSTYGNNLEVKCDKCGGTFKRGWKYFNNGTIGCPECSIKEKNELITSQGYTIISTNLGKVVLKCKNGHTLERNYSALCLTSITCDECAKEEKIKFITENTNFEAIEYNNASMVTVKCKTCGAIKTTDYSNIIKTQHIANNVKTQKKKSF